MCQSRKPNLFTHTHTIVLITKVINVCVDDDTNWTVNDKIDIFTNLHVNCGSQLEALDQTLSIQPKYFF